MNWDVRFWGFGRYGYQAKARDEQGVLLMLDYGLHSVSKGGAPKLQRSLLKSQPSQSIPKSHHESPSVLGFLCLQLTTSWVAVIPPHPKKGPTIDTLTSQMGTAATHLYSEPCV